MHGILIRKRTKFIMSGKPTRITRRVAADTKMVSPHSLTGEGNSNRSAVSSLSTVSEKSMRRKIKTIHSETQTTNCDMIKLQDKLFNAERKAKAFECQLSSLLEKNAHLEEQLNCREQVIDNLTEKMKSFQEMSALQAMNKCEKGMQTDTCHAADIYTPTCVDAGFSSATGPTTISTENKRKLLILSDSHGRNLLNFTRNFENYETQVIFKPNAAMAEIVKDIQGLTNGYGAEDFVFVMGGSNDNYAGFQIRTLKTIVEVSSRTNVILAYVPYRYDHSHLNNQIFILNSKIHDFIDKHKEPTDLISILDVNRLLHRRHFTGHGLHISNKGKKLLMGCLSGHIMEIQSRRGTVARRKITQCENENEQTNEKRITWLTKNADTIESIDEVEEVPLNVSKEEHIDEPAYLAALTPLRRTTSYPQVSGREKSEDAQATVEDLQSFWEELQLEETL